MELERHRKKGLVPIERVRVGTMLEVPALAWQLPALLKRIDFLSIGSNDLTQFVFAIDRGNSRVADRYDTLSPAMLNLLRNVAQECRKASVPLSVCGEMAGRPIEAMALLGVGIRSLSMSPPSIGPVKAMVRSLFLPALEEYMESLYSFPGHSTREYLRSFAVDHGVQI
jgi:phosphotransferase system enzyme I (PtsP)